MLDIITPNGYKATSDGECITISSQTGTTLLSYHPLQAEVIWGFHSEATIFALREDLAYVRKLLTHTFVE